MEKDVDLTYVVFYRYRESCPFITFLFLYGCRQQPPPKHKAIVMPENSPSRHAEYRANRDLHALSGVFQNAMLAGDLLYLKFSSVFLKLSLFLKKDYENALKRISKTYLVISMRSAACCAVSIYHSGHF